jgi:2-polyprenyl-3-methyl-5-hydroxy-6-metoxy-1,4-benzoquinol methylase
MKTRETLKILYRSEDGYRSYSAENPKAVQRLRRAIRERRRSVGLALLDLCCGGGALAWAYERPGRSYVGMDTDPDMIREARRNARSGIDRDH